METGLSSLSGNLYIAGAILVGICVIATIIILSLQGDPAVTAQAAANTMSVYKKGTALAPLGSDPSTKLCDYYVASSAYSLFPGSSTNDYISDGVVVLVIKAGARLIELDIYDDGNQKPTVGLKNQALGYDYAKNSVSLEKCCVAIANTAFSVDVPVASDPFFLSLMFHTDNTNVLNATGEIIKESLGRFLLPPEYSFHRKPLATEPIDNLKGKLVIVSGGGIQGSAFEELVNISWSTSQLRRLTYMQASQPYDHEELVDSNRNTICMVVPSPDPDLKNNNPTILFGYGCQWNLMNYGSPDTMMELNIEKFQQGSLVLKPEELRYHPVEAKTPKLPDPSTHSFQPMMHDSPLYDTNAKTGSKSIII